MNVKHFGLVFAVSVYLGLFLLIPSSQDRLLAQSAAAPGGFLQAPSNLTARPTLSAGQVAGFLPQRGVFNFPAPYNTQGIRITNSSDCGGGTDCVLPVGYSFWRRMNNHVGSNTMLILMTLDRNRGGQGPTLFSYNKTTGATTKVGPIFDSTDPLSWAHGEMFYFSATRPTSLYVHDGPRFLRYDVLSRTSEVVFDVSAQFGSDKYLWSAHSSNDDKVHSFTLRRNSDYAMLGCGVYNENTQAYRFFDAAADFDECQIDKSGRFLVIKQQVDGAQGEDNLIQDLATGAQRLLVDPAGAGGHSDEGFGYMVAEDNYASQPGTVRLWRLDMDPADPANGRIVYTGTDWGLGANHIAHSNAVNTAPDQQMACSSSVTRQLIARANEVICYKLDGSRTALIVAPVMTNMDASGGGDDYYKAPKGNLDVTGEYFIWSSNMGTNRMDAFIVRVPKQVLYGGAPAPTPTPTPTPSGSSTLTLARPSGGTILGPEIFCGDGGAACAVTKPTGTTIELLALPAPGNTLVSWGGCAPSLALTASRSCTPTFGGSAAAVVAAPTGPPTLTIARPSGGTILGPEIFCGDGGAACSVTKPAGTAIELLALPSGSNVLTTWGGCAAALTLTTTISCTPVFGSSAPPPPGSAPPASSGGGAAVLSIARMAGGTVIGPSLFCGDMGAACDVTLARGTAVELAVLVSAGHTFSGWLSCATTFVLDGAITCTPSYDGGAPPPPPPPPSGSIALSINNAGGGFILGPEMVCEPGNVGTCQVSYSSTRVVTLIPVPYAGFWFSGWAESGCSSVMVLSTSKTCTAVFRR